MNEKKMVKRFMNDWELKKKCSLTKDSDIEELVIEIVKKTCAECEKEFSELEYCVCGEPKIPICLCGEIAKALRMEGEKKENNHIFKKLEDMCASGEILFPWKDREKFKEAINEEKSC